MKTTEQRELWPIWFLSYCGQEERSLLGWVGLGWVGLGWVGLGWVGLGWVGLGWVGLHESWSNPQHGRFNGSIELESKSLIYYYFLLDVDETKEA
jgi:hypothetical protein